MLAAVSCIVITGACLAHDHTTLLEGKGVDVWERLILFALRERLKHQGQSLENTCMPSKKLELQEAAHLLLPESNSHTVQPPGSHY